LVMVRKYSPASGKMSVAQRSHMTLRNCILDQGVSRAEIEQVILVDAWRQK
jgi:hypothetical protein